MPLFRYKQILLFLLSLLTQYRHQTAAASSSSSAAPWQATSSTNNVIDQERYRDLPPIVFAPGGRLYSVEQYLQAANNHDDISANLVVAIQCNNNADCVVVSTSPKSPHLDIHESSSSDDKKDKDEDEMPLWIHSDSNTFPRPPLARLAPHLWLATGGNAADGAVLRSRIHDLADNLREELDDGGSLETVLLVPASTLARRIADQLQLPTQSIASNSAGRILASSALLMDGKQLWRIDPTGQFWNCHAAVIGRGARKAEEYLLDRVIESKHFNVQSYLSSLSVQDAVDLACECLAKVHPKDDQRQWQALVLSEDWQEEIRQGSVLSMNI